MTDDILDQVHAEGQARRQAQADARREFKKSPKSKAGRKARQRGLAFERKTAKFLGGQVVMGSGALDGLPGDVKVGPLLIQCKETPALKTQKRWLVEGRSDIVFQGEPGGQMDEALAVTTATVLRWLLALGEALDWGRRLQAMEDRYVLYRVDGETRSEYGRAGNLALMRSYAAVIKEHSPAHQWEIIDASTGESVPLVEGGGKPE